MMLQLEMYEMTVYPLRMPASFLYVRPRRKVVLLLPETVELYFAGCDRRIKKRDYCFEVSSWYADATFSALLYQLRGR